MSSENSKNLPVQNEERSEDDSGEALANGANDVVVVRKTTGQLVVIGWYGQIGKLNSFFQSREGKEVTIFVEGYEGGQGMRELQCLSFRVPVKPKMIVQDSGSFRFKDGSPQFMTSEEPFQI